MILKANYCGKLSLTVYKCNDIINHSKEIEVAFLISIFSDVSGTDDEKRKGKTPKDEIS